MATVILVAAWCTVNSGSLPQTLAAPSNAPSQIQAVAYAGATRIVFALSTQAGERRTVTARLWAQRHHAGVPTVTLGFSPVPGRVRDFQRMSLKRGTYDATVSMEQHGSWHVLLRLREPRESSASRTVAFLVRWQSGGRPSSSVVYPLFMPTTAGYWETSVPLGPFVATLRAVIGAIGDARIYIQLQPISRGTPSALRLQIIMLDMAMGQTSVIARRVRHGQYVAQAFFSMPGAWSVSVSIRTASTPAALIVGEEI